MADITYYIVLAFSRTDEREFRVETTMKAPSKQHAMSAATHLAGDWGGTVAFSITGDASKAEWECADILALFGDLPGDRALYQELNPIWTSERSRSTGALGNVMPEARLSSIIPFATRREPSARRAPKLSPVIAGLTAVGLAAPGQRHADHDSQRSSTGGPACGNGSAGLFSYRHHQP